MKRLLLVLAVILTALIPVLSGGQGTGGSAFHKNDITYSTAVQTPHVRWAGKLPGGPIRGFFIPSVQYGRDMVELMQRLELSPTTVSVDRNWDTNCWGIGDYYGHEYRGDRDDFRTVFGYVEQDLTGPSNFEVLVIPGLNGWTRMTRASRDAILRRVEAGAGLVLIHPFVGDVERHPFAGDEKTGDRRIWDVSPLVDCPNDTVNEGGYPELNRDAIVTGKWEITRPHFITSGVPMDLLPDGSLSGAFYRYRAAGDVLIAAGGHPVLAVKEYGKGRVAAFAYVEDGFVPSGSHSRPASDEDGAFGSGINPYSTGIYWNYWEYYYSLLARAIVWSAGRAPGLELQSASAHLGGEPAIEVALQSPAAMEVELEVTAGSGFGPRLGSSRQRVRLAAGSARLSVPLAPLRPQSGWPGGKLIFDMVWRDPASGTTLNWATVTADRTESAGIVSIRPAADVYREGETISAAVRAGGSLDGLRVRFRVSDDLDRVITEQEAPARGERYFYAPLAHYLGRYARLEADLLDGRGRLVDHFRAQPVLVVQESRRKREFNPLVAFGASKHMFSSVRMRQVRAVAADTGFTWGGSVNNGLNIPRGAFGVYWYDRGPTTPEQMERAVSDFNQTLDFDALQYLTRKELYRRTGDTRFLARVPSFSDPAFMSRLRSIVHAVARGKARYNMDYYFVGDEGSLTSYTDPYDFDWSVPALAAFRDWVKAEYGSLEALNRSWKSGYTRWEDVKPATTEEATKSGNFAPWADHRTFMEQNFADAYRSVREAVVAGDPDGHIALSGTQVTTAYNGCDWYRLDQIIDDFLSYDGGNQWDLHRSFAKPGSMIGFWTGYESKGIPLQNAIWTAAVHNVLHPNVFWMLSFLNPDFTHSQSARDMGEVFKTLKYGGVGKLLMEAERLQDGIAIHYSMPSVHAASITRNHPERGRPEVGRDFPANRDGWVRMIKDLGMQFNFVASEQIEKGLLKSKGYRALVLPMSMAISSAEAAAIRGFAETGGIVIADAAAGVMDDHCAWQPQNMLGDLFGVTAPPSAARRLAGATRSEHNADGDVAGKVQTPGVAGAVQVTAEGNRWGLRDDGLRGFEAVETGVGAGSSRALLRVGGTEAAFVRQAGRGWAVYLNSLLDRYPDRRSKQFAGGEYRTLVGGIFARLGVRPAIDIRTLDGKQLSQAHVVRYRLGDRQVLAIVKENVGLEGIVGRDGVTAYSDARLGLLAKEELQIRLPRPAVVSDVVQSKPLGRTDTIRTSIVVGGALLLGIDPEAVTLALEGPVAGRLGVPVTLGIRAAGKGPHLVRCHIFGPDGAFLAVYARNITVAEGRGSFTFLPALNDPNGRYRIEAIEVVSGAAAKHEIVLE